MKRRLITAAFACVALLATATVAPAQPLNANGSPNPADPGLRLWLDSSDLSSLYQDVGGTTPAAAGQPVRRWDDKSQSNISVQQNDGVHHPTYAGSVGSLGGVPAVSFVGGANGDALTSTTGNSTGITGGGPLTLLTVWQRTGATSQNYQHTFQMGTTSTLQAYGHSVSRGANLGEISNHYWGDGFNSSGTSPLGAGKMAVSTYDGATDTWYVDGAPAGTRSVVVNIANTQLQVGSRLNPFVEGFTGDLAEVILIDRVLTDDERNRLGGYVQLKYGLQIQDAVVIPEPSTVVLALLGMVGLCLAAWRRKQRA